MKQLIDQFRELAQECEFPRLYAWALVLGTFAAIVTGIKIVAC